MAFHAKLASLSIGCTWVRLSNSDTGTTNTFLYAHRLVAITVVFVENDYLKFFQSFIASMVQIGGINLPKSVSTMLGRNLGQVYTNRGETDPKVALESMFKAMGADNVQFQPNEGTEDESMDFGFTVTTEYPSEFCPIGGELKPKRHGMFFEGICQPYASAFLSTFRPGAKVNLTCDRCVLRDGDNKCIIKAEFSE